MPITVQVPDVGDVEFPDSMSQAQIVDAIERDILPSVKKSPSSQASPSMRAAIAPPGENPAGVVNNQPATLLEREAQRIAPKTLTEAELQKADIALDEAMAEPVGGALPDKVKKFLTDAIVTSNPLLNKLSPEVTEGLAEGLIELEEGIRTAPGLVMGAGAMLPGNPGTVAKLILSGVMAKGFGESLAELDRASAAGEKKASAKAALNSLVSGLGAAGLGRSVASELLAKPPVIPGSVPITAEALKAQQAALEPNQRVNLESVSKSAEAVSEKPTIVSEEPPIVPKEPEIVGMGGAVPSEFEAAKSVTSIKNAQVDVERAARGLPPAIEPARREFGEVWDRAIAEIDRDAGVQDRLIGELRENPRALTDTENALLLHRQVDLQNEYAKAARDLAQAYDDGRLDAAVLEQARVEGISNQLLDLYEVGKSAGTETGRGLAARKMMANEDFSLASLEMQKRSDLGGRPLTDFERAELVKIADEYKAKSEDLETRLATAEERLSESVSKQTYDDLVKEVEKQPKINPSVLEYAERFVSKMEAASEKYAKEIFGQFNSPTPDVLAKAAFIGATKIARGVVELAKWTDEMAGLLGEGFRKYADEIYKASNERLKDELSRDKSGPKVRTVISKAKDAAEERAATIDKIKTAIKSDGDISTHVHKLARSFVAQGIRGRDNLVNAVRAELVKISPEITKLDTVHAISGYGKFKLLSKDVIDTELRDLKGQLQQVSKLEDMQSGKAPSKTGVERRVPSDEERRLIKQVEEAKKKGGYKVTDPETQLRTALQSIKTRLRNDIADLEQQIRTKTKIVPEKRGVAYDAEAKALKERRDALRTEFDKVFGKAEMTNEQRVKLATAAAEKSIAELERRIKEGDLTPAKKLSRTKETPALKAIRAIRDALKEQIKELKKLDEGLILQKEAKSVESKRKAIEKDIAEIERKIKEGDIEPKGASVNRPARPELEPLKQKRDALREQLDKLRNPERTADEISLQSFKTRTATKIAELEEKIAKGDFTTRKKPELALDEAATKLKFDLEKVRQKWLEARFVDRLARELVAQKIFRNMGEALNFSRAVITSVDLSAVLRQGGFITIGNPVRAIRAMGPMLEALKSEKGQFRAMEQIRNSSDYRLAKQSGLYLAEDSPLSLNKLEEAYMSRWASKVPGVAASQRAYTTFLNKLRMDSFSAMIKSLSKSGTPTALEAQVIANYINIATGRGNLGKFNQAAVGLNTVFFSPRLVASRLQLLAGQPLYRGSLRTRKLIAMEYAKFLGGIGLLYGLAQLADFDVEFDSNSSDFGKVRIGNTRIDPLTGLSQVTVFVSRMASGETKSIKGKVTPIRGDVPYGSPDAVDVIKRFLRTKLSPAFGASLDILSGSNINGDPTTPASVAENLLVPMSFDDILEAMQEQGIPKGTAIALLSLLGMGIQTFDPNKPKPERPK